MRGLAVGTVVAVVLALAAGPARGAGDADNDPDIEVAKRHFNAGGRYYEALDYRRALDEFRAAQRVKPAPAFDYNIARCHDRLEEYPQAIAAYERFIAAAPGDPDTAQARERVRVLRTRVAEAEVPNRGNIAVPPNPPIIKERTPPPNPPMIKERTPVPPKAMMPDPTTPPPATPVYRKGWFWAVVGGTALVAAGVGVGVSLFGGPPDPTLGRVAGN